MKLFPLLLASFASIALGADVDLPPKAALDAIKAEDLLKHIKVLSSDEFEGRAPGSKGEELTVKYLTEQFKAIGLKPGNPNGTYTQEVPLAGIITHPTASFRVGDEKIQLKFPTDYVASSARLQEKIKVEDSEMIFVGYGVVAPEYGWDDYKDVDVKGKTIVMLINDPAIPDPADESMLDPKMFKGRAMTYYGRWSYKYEIAAQKGAAAAVIVHETEPAAYPWSVIESSWGTENFEIDAPNKNMDQVEIRSWITLETAKKLFRTSKLDFDELKKRALQKDFRPVPLQSKASFALQQKVRTFKSHNILARIEGSDPKLKDEWIMYSAHWDHLGRNPEMKGDNIYNGALDNASGVAAILALAQAHEKLPQPTKRSVLIMATTAEESGLLGAKFYAENPLYSARKNARQYQHRWHQRLGRNQRHRKHQRRQFHPRRHVRRSRQTAGPRHDPEQQTRTRQLLPRRSLRLLQARRPRPLHRPRRRSARPARRVGPAKARRIRRKHLPSAFR